MARLEYYISVGKGRLRCGYTTGTCAAAAASGAAALLLLGETLPAVQIETPAGILVEAELLQPAQGADWASCAVRKDGGDDPDVTDGTLICARVERTAGTGIEIDGGIGVGQVTRPGLDQPVGAAAINSTPRRMIVQQVQALVEQAGYDGGLRVVISVPEGEALASHTFNPRLGIENGISILGTSGIVRPMSEAALIDSLRLELDMQYAAGGRDVVVTPGNYGEEFAKTVLDLRLDCWAACSNYIGEAVDHAAGLGFHSFLLIGHLGKLCKTAAGIMNTHSRVADGRRECLCAHAALCGGDRETVKRLFEAITTEESVDLLEQSGLRPAVMQSLADALEEVLRRRAGETMEIGALFFSNRYGVLGQTAGAGKLISLHRRAAGK